MIRKKTGEEYFGPMDSQFVVIEYFNNGTQYNSSWSGVDFDNSWNAAVEYAKRYVLKNPDMYCIVNDRMGRKKDFTVSSSIK